MVFKIQGPWVTGQRTSFLDGSLGACVETLDDSPAREIVGGEFDGHPVTGKDSNAVHPHAPGDMRQHFVSSLRFDSERRVGKILFHDPSQLDRVLGHNRTFRT